MDAMPELPSWVRPSVVELQDGLFLALDMVERNSREAAGVIAVILWLVGEAGGPTSGRPEGPGRREVAMVELCAAEHLADDGPVPPLRVVCDYYGVAYYPHFGIDAGYGRGAWLGLRWALGQGRPPVDLPIRRPSGDLMSEAEIYAELRRRGEDRTTALKHAASLIQGSRWMAAIVDDMAAKYGAGQ